MGWHRSYKEAVRCASHLIALGETEIYLDHDDPDLPWHLAEDVEGSCSRRLNGPSGFYVVARSSGLSFKWNVDFEERGANGQPVSMFDRGRLREVIRKLPAPARRRFGALLTAEVLPALEMTTAEWRGYLNRQMDSEDCVRGLITSAESTP